MHPIGNFAADDRSPELQVGKLSTISSADRIFIHRVLLQGKDRHLLGSAMVRHTVPPCFTIYTSHQSVKGSISNFSSLFAALEFAADCVARNKLSFRLIFSVNHSAHLWRVPGRCTDVPGCDRRNRAW